MSPLLIKLHGTSGSGKTETVRRALFEDPALDRMVVPIPDRWPHVHSRRKAFATRFVHPVDPPNITVIGDYAATCGGCDGIKTQDDVTGRVQHFLSQGENVVFEGLLISQIYGRYMELARDAAATHEVVYGFLDTPLDLCLDRVRERRERAGNFSPLNTSNTESKWHDMQRNLLKYRADGVPVESIPWQESVAWLRRKIGRLPLFKPKSMTGTPIPRPSPFSRNAS